MEMELKLLNQEITKWQEMYSVIEEVKQNIHAFLPKNGTIPDVELQSPGIWNQVVRVHTPQDPQMPPALSSQVMVHKRSVFWDHFGVVSSKLPSHQNTYLYAISVNTYQAFDTPQPPEETSASKVIFF